MSTALCLAPNVKSLLGSTARGFSSNAPVSSGDRETLDRWIAHIQGLTVVEQDEITRSAAQLLATTLYPSAPSAPAWDSVPVGSELPPAYHLVCFPPREPECRLASDGYDTSFTPPAPYLKRMWAGGSFEWNLENPLRIGDRVSQTTKVDRIQVKPGAQGDLRVFVWMKKDIANEAGPSMQEVRCLVYMDARSRVSDPGRVLKGQFPSSTRPNFSRQIKPTALTLFRYSALTFNSHLIHYDPDYCRAEEGYPERLVHGPLTCTLLLDLLHKRLAETQGIQHRRPFLRSFEYRALSPLYCGQDLHLHGRVLDREPATAGEMRYELWATNAQGGLAMKGTAVVTERDA
ncbi:HotDog domain-containing protein [Polychytrium aggregatum]|uniref:HotDog domain-containing protein n=1 Tax=Polychytrium aggregatum TaxID=110093 RepID=UPI0022FE6B74|nr:HotDog domain-containing protein [Polychytrium aggregatum]KAI9206872.1 HotDog domain-containing protein [Polychytrium aggregatum]